MIVVVLAEVTEGGMDSRVLAMLGVLTAVNAVLRGLSARDGRRRAGVLPADPRPAGCSGPGFGFVLGCTSLFASALLTAGVGPWLPYQMLVSAWVGMGAGLLPRRVTGRAEIAMLVAYGMVAAYAFGLLMNLSGWPFALGIAVPGHEGRCRSCPGDPLCENLHRFGDLHAAHLDGQLGHRPRDHQPVALIVVLGPAVLATLRRASRRATVAGTCGDRLPGSPDAPAVDNWLSTAGA